MVVFERTVVVEVPTVFVDVETWDDLGYCAEKTFPDFVSRFTNTLPEL